MDVGLGGAWARWRARLTAGRDRAQIVAGLPQPASIKRRGFAVAWKKNKDPLFRGDDRAAVRLPHPTAAGQIVRHVLQLDGTGTESPYLSTTEAEQAAAFFAGPRGRVWQTAAPKCEASAVQHRPRKELLQLLRGTGYGDAGWPSAAEVLRAKAFVEQWQEHLLDFRTQPTDDAALRAVVTAVFS